MRFYLLAVWVLFIPSAALAQGIGNDPAEVLQGDGLKAFEELQAAGGNRIRSVGLTFDKQARLANLHFNRPLAATDAPLLRRISNLGTLFFTSRNTLSGEQLGALGGVGLQGLVIWNQSVRDEDLKALRQCPCLTHLTLNGTEVTDAGLANLKDMQLTRCFLAKCLITDAGLKTLSQLTSLQILDISQCGGITDDGVAHLSSLPNLENLFLHDDELLTGAILARLKTLPKLKRLGIVAAKVKSEDLQTLEAFRNLEMLSAGRTNLDDNAAKCLMAAKSLKELYLQDTKLTDAGLASLGALTQLVSLSLDETEIANEGLAHLGGLTDLTSLSLKGTRISDGGVQALRGLTKLKRLNIAGTKITDASLDALSAFKELTYLNIDDTAISAAGKKRLQEQLPKWKTPVPLPRAQRPARPPRVRPMLPPKRDQAPDFRDRLTNNRPGGGAAPHWSGSREMQGYDLPI